MSLLKSFTDKFKNVLGPSSEEILAEENQEVIKAQQRLNEAKKKTTERRGKDCLSKTNISRECANPKRSI